MSYFHFQFSFIFKTNRFKDILEYSPEKMLKMYAIGTLGMWVVKLVVI